MATAFKKMLSKKNEQPAIKDDSDSSSDDKSSSGSEEPIITKKTETHLVKTDLLKVEDLVSKVSPQRA